MCRWLGAIKVLSRPPGVQLSPSPLCPRISLCKTGLANTEQSIKHSFPNLKHELTHPFDRKILHLNCLPLSPWTEKLLSHREIPGRGLSNAKIKIHLCELLLILFLEVLPLTGWHYPLSSHHFILSRHK